MSDYARTGKHSDADLARYAYYDEGEAEIEAQNRRACLAADRRDRLRFFIDHEPRIACEQEPQERQW